MAALLSHHSLHLFFLACSRLSFFPSFFLRLFAFALALFSGALLCPGVRIGFLLLGVVRILIHDARGTEGRWQGQGAGTVHKTGSPGVPRVTLYAHQTHGTSTLAL